MVKQDFHGMVPQDVEQTVHNLISQIRLKNKNEMVHFITGRGSHRDLVMEILKNYNLLPDYQIGNDGVIVVNIE